MLPCPSGWIRLHFSKDRSTIRAETRTAAKIFQRVCKGLLQCQKQATLCPQTHPRVQASLTSIKDALAEFQVETGQPFLLDISEALEETANEQENRGESADVILARLLERRLIDKLLLPTGVTRDELYEFCFLLRDEAIKQSEKRDQILVDLNQLEQIRLSF